LTSVQPRYRGVQIEHELDQGAVQLCQRAAEHGKARAGDLARQLAVQATEPVPIST
jgi:hypothetical protein